MKTIENDAMIYSADHNLVELRIVFVCTSSFRNKSEFTIFTFFISYKSDIRYNPNEMRNIETGMRFAARSNYLITSDVHAHQDGS